MKAELHFQLGKNRQRQIYEACQKGLRSCGFTKQSRSDFLVTWGIHKGNRQIIQQYRDQKKPVIIFDLGYWGRKVYFKASVNQAHPENVLAEKFSGERYEKSGGVPIRQPQEGGDFVLLAAMGWKGCAAYGQGHGEWDAAAYRKIKAATETQIVWKAKPSDPTPVVPQGVIPYTGGTKLQDYSLERCKAIVTHHGNCAVEALALGIPAFCVDGAAAQICNFDLSKIDTAKVSENRVQFLYNLAHWQWTVDEIANGKMFQDYTERGLI